MPLGVRMTPETQAWGETVLPVMLAGFTLGVGLVAALLSAAARWARQAVGSL